MPPRAVLLFALAACDAPPTDEPQLPGHHPPDAPTDPLHDQLQTALLVAVKGVLGVRNQVDPAGPVLGEAYHGPTCPGRLPPDDRGALWEGGCTTPGGVGFEGLRVVGDDSITAQDWRVTVGGELLGEVDGRLELDDAWWIFSGWTNGPHTARMDDAGLTLDAYRFEVVEYDDVHLHIYQGQGTSPRWGAFTFDVQAYKRLIFADHPSAWRGTARFELLGHVLDLDMDTRDADTGCPTTWIDGERADPLCLM